MVVAPKGWQIVVSACATGAVVRSAASETSEVSAQFQQLMRNAYPPLS
nr:hypothetical protein [Streptomyces sp. MMG1533]